MPDERSYARTGQDRRKHLRVPLEGVVTLEGEGTQLSVRCSEMSVGGMLVHAPEAWAIGRELAAKALLCSGKSFELGAFVRVAAVAEAAADDGSRATELDFIDLDGVARGCIQAAFSHVIAPLLRQESPVIRFNWAFRDVGQVAEVCKTLLVSVELTGVWTDVGPSESARSYLVGNGEGLAAPHRAMLRIVWKLWCGSLDVPEPDELPAHAKACVAALRKAIIRGPTGVDEWLAVERRHRDTTT